MFWENGKLCDVNFVVLVGMILDGVVVVMVGGWFYGES